VVAHEVIGSRIASHFHGQLFPSLRSRKRFRGRVQNEHVEEARLSMEVLVRRQPSVSRQVCACDGFRRHKLRRTSEVMHV
jgi:hypothetical protein